MSIVAIVSCHQLEEPQALEITIKSILDLENVDVIVGYDRFIPESHRSIIDRYSAYRDRISTLIANTIGIGNNRNLLAQRAIELGYEYIIQSDCHVRFLSRPNTDNSVYLHMPIGDDEFYSGMVTQQKEIYFGTLHAYDDIRNIRFVFKARFITHFSEPVFVIDTKILRNISDMQCGYVYILPGYSHEIADVMLTVSRLGYRFTAYQTLLYQHRINTGKEDRWVKRWDKEQMELFLTNLTLYEAKHGFPKRYYDDKIAEKHRDRLECAIECSNSLKYSTKEIYDIIDREISNGYMIVR